ncbi:MAG: SRPBCC domain-containing protein [Alphaproteobacteria bacterium]|nr:SRPBCC domain-containing protein [Alphaproteobacteria bacterium]
MNKSVTVETPGETDIVITRRFNAPKALVWRAYTEPELLKRWLGGMPGWSMTVCEIDLRVGGGYRWRWRNDDSGAEFGFVATFHAIEPEHRILNTERAEDVDMPEAEIEVLFEPLGDMTRLKMVIHYADAAARKAALDTGMTDGMGLCYDLLDEVLAEMVG